MGSVHPELTALFDRHACSSFDKQLFFRELVRGHDWVFELEKGTVRFGQELCWKVQVLGTESEKDRTWTWAWAGDDVPQPLLQATSRLQEQGREAHITELIEPRIGLDEQLSGDVIGLIAMGICGGNAYFRAGFDGGSLYLMIKDDAFPPCVVKPVKRIVEVFPQVVQAFQFNHRNGFGHYARYYGLRVKSRGTRLLADGEHQRAQAEFDDSGKVVSVQRFRLPGV